MQQDIDACAELKRDAIVNSSKMPSGFAAEWAKTFATHEANLQGVAERLQEFLHGKSTAVASFMAESNGAILAYKADTKTCRRLFSEYKKRSIITE